MTTKSLYLILCVAASLTLLAFTQKTITAAGQPVASSTSVNGQPAIMQRPTTSTTNIDRGTSTGATTSGTTDGTTNTTNTTSTNSSTSMDYPTTTGTHTAVASPNPGLTTSSGNTTTMDIPTTGGGTTNPNW